MARTRVNSVIGILFLAVFLPFLSFGQKIFSHPKGAVIATIKKSKYKIHFLSSDISFKVSRNQKQLFSVDTALCSELEKAIREQYVAAHRRYLDVEENSSPYPHQPIDTNRLSVAELKSLRRKTVLASAEKTARKKLHRFDRYFIGYENAKGERWIYIMFDPHRIKKYTMGGERHIRNLSPMVYNLTTKQLFIGGWAGEGE